MRVLGLTGAMGVACLATGCSDDQHATLATSTTVSADDLVYPIMDYGGHCDFGWTIWAYGRVWVAEDWTLGEDVLPRSGTVVPLSDEVLLYTDSVDGTEARFLLSTGTQTVCS